MQAFQVHRLNRDLLNLFRRVHDGVDPLVFLRIAIALCHQIPSSAFGHGKSGLSVFIGNGAGNVGGSAAGQVHPCQLYALQRLGGLFQGSRVFIAIAFHCKEALYRNGNLIAGHHLVGCLHPGIVIGIIIRIAHHIKVQLVAVGNRGIGNKGTIITAAGDCRRTIIGVPLVHIETAGIGLHTKDDANPAGAADLQVFAGGLLGKSIAKNQFMGLYQGIQCGNAIHAVAIAVFFRGTGGNGNLLQAVEVTALHLRTNRHLYRRRLLLLHGHGVGLSLAAVVVHAGPAGVAAFNGDDRAVCNGYGFRTLVLFAVHAGAHLIVFIARGRRHHYAGYICTDSQGIGMGVLTKSRRKRPLAEGQALYGFVGTAPAAAQILAAIAAIHKADFIAGGKCPLRCGKGVKAFIDKPVVERAHPAAHPTGVFVRCF